MTRTKARNPKHAYMAGSAMAADVAQAAVLKLVHVSKANMPQPQHARHSAWPP